MKKNLGLDMWVDVSRRGEQTGCGDGCGCPDGNGLGNGDGHGDGGRGRACDDNVDFYRDASRVYITSGFGLYWGNVWGDGTGDGAHYKMITGDYKEGRGDDHCPARVDLQEWVLWLMKRQLGE